MSITDKNYTKDEIVEILQSHPEHEGWIGIECPDCCSYPDVYKYGKVTANVEKGTIQWQCPRCRMIAIIHKELPIHLSPTYGVSGLAIIAAYEELGYNVAEYLNEIEQKFEKEKESKDE